MQLLTLMDACQCHLDIVRYFGIIVVKVYMKLSVLRQYGNSDDKS